MMHKHGFTLVELSIVLVIIGLLIGGVLVGQSLIETAKSQKIATAANQMYIKFGMFQERFKELPGDVRDGYNRFRLSTSCDPNGFIGGITGSPACSGGELGNAFRDLYRAGFSDLDSPGGYTVCRYTGGASGEAEGVVPVLEGVDSYNNSKILFCAYNSYNSRLTYDPTRGILYQQEPFSYISLQNSQMPESGSPTSWGTSGALNVSQSFYLDKKLDDSKPGTGKIRTARNRVFLSSGCVDGNYTADANTLDWDFSEDVECIPLFVLDFNNYHY